IDTSEYGRIRVGLQDAYGIDGYEEAWLTFLEGERLVLGPNVNCTQFRTATSYCSTRLIDIDDYEDALILDRIPDGLTVGDYIFPGDESGTSAMDDDVPREFMGLHGHVDDGSIVNNYHGIPRDEHRLWRGIVIDASDDSVPGDGTLSEEILVYA